MMSGCQAARTARNTPSGSATALLPQDSFARAS